MSRARTVGDPCVVCKTRKSRRSNGCCERCDALTDAEGTKKQLGIPTESAVRMRWRQQATEYNRLVREGKRQQEIAQLWGMTIRQLRSLIFRMKTKGNIAVINMQRGNPEKKPTTKVRPRGANNHGEGKWGVRDCTCEPCLTVRAASRKEIDTKRINRVKVLEAEIAALREVLGKKPKAKR